MKLIFKILSVRAAYCGDKRQPPRHIRSGYIFREERPDSSDHCVPGQSYGHPYDSSASSGGSAAHFLCYQKLMSKIRCKPTAPDFTHTAPPSAKVTSLSCYLFVVISAHSSCKNYVNVLYLLRGGGT